MTTINTALSRPMWARSFLDAISDMAGWSSQKDAAMDGICVLIIEDDDSLGRSLKNIFETMTDIPVNVRVVHGSLDALPLIPSCHAVLLDHHIAGQGGGSLLRKIRERSDVPVIVFTGNNDPDIAKEAKDLNAELYIKPDAWGALTALEKAMTSYVERRFGRKAR